MPKPKKNSAPKPKPLTDKQKRFCEEYLIDFNGTQAAIRAGYSKKTAQQQASRLLSNVVVQDYLSELRGELKERSLVDAQYITEGLKRIAKGGDTSSAQVSAYDKLGKHIGYYETDNAQKGAARSEELERLLAVGRGDE